MKRFKFIKKTKLMKGALCATILAALVLVGCEELDIYSINSPDDLQSKIDSIQAAKPNTGDTTYLNIATPFVGADDFSSGWWSVWSDYFTIPTGKLLHLEFINHTTCATTGNNWENWVLVTANLKAHTSDAAKASEMDYDADYKEYFALRADAWGWGGGMADVDEAYAFSTDLIVNDYPDTDGDGDVWNDFRRYMDNAYVTLIVDHSATGVAFVTATMVTTDGTILTETCQSGVSATDDIVTFLACEVSYLEMKTAYLLPSEVTVIEDVNPASLTLTGTPTAVELGDTNFWGNAVATVTFEDGTSQEVDSADLTFSVIPDMTTVGTKNVIVVYNKTKQGEFCETPVTAFYNLTVTNAVTSLEVTTLPDVTTYTYPGPVAPIFDTTGIVVTATYSDGTSAVIPNANLKFENPGGEGAQDAIITFVGATSTVTTTCAITNVTGGTNQVGATDFTNAWWTTFANNYKVPSGDSITFKMTCYSSGTNNWNSPCTILRKANLTEYAVLRMDNFGWGDSYAAATLTNDWDFDVFAANINESYIEITVTNVGDGTANVRYDVTYANSDTHYQLYEGITVEASDLTTSLVIEGAYIDITSVE